ncbi:hypothetical protein GCM10020000_85280 [Streptomyces olivoverticillatus]
MEIPSPELFYELLPVHYVQKIDARRGVKVLGLWYDGPALAPYRGQRSTRGGKHKGQWVIRRDPRDRRTVFFQDPLTHGWHPLPWTGLPPNGQAPAFGDARVRELLKKAAAHGLRPRTGSIHESWFWLNNCGDVTVSGRWQSPWSPGSCPKMISPGPGGADSSGSWKMWCSAWRSCCSRRSRMSRCCR